ncbi:hypothetical protein GSI_02709 [Ganoderma sinense ZZ0214-1]|uniref:Fe2OG dioxygenase domain-containing protein n=1 Tax=Ganoderma sinense ZZ0214-1 TaxID=1077348 RepID=A0A2G8SMD2_9APHY|nr:hypothetical protein GSI_02709 [Ganoderma sinense ZZ0214-1]
MSKGKQDENEKPPLRWPKHLKYMKSSIVAKPPYCKGTLALPNTDFTLFYGSEGDAHYSIHLADACAPGTFGVAGEDVYDETYRKAGKLDAKNFATTFDTRSTSLVNAIRIELLIENPKRIQSEDVSIEPYKLNVYGKDAFFKAHVDTPRSELMFGSLVIVFPTPHEGGALKLRALGRKEGEILEWTFDASALLAQQEQPSIAYVAFFSDVEHEVMPVTFGHRVTLTYSLFYVPAESKPPAELTQISTNEQSSKTALRAALQDETFLPTGGTLMFGLRHQYPLATSYSSSGEHDKAALRALEPRLKATDGVIDILKMLRDAALRLVYEANWSPWSHCESFVLTDRVLPLPETHETIEQGAAECLQAFAGSESRGRDPGDDATPVYWVTGHPLRMRRTGVGARAFEKTVQTYGNEPALDVVYWRIWIHALRGSERPWRLRPRRGRLLHDVLTT